MLRYLRVRGLLLASIAISFLVGWYCAQALGLPVYRGFNASLLNQPTLAASVTGVLGAALAFFVAVAVSTVLCRSISHDSGVACAGFALLAFSVRGGPMFYTLGGSGRGVYLALALELVILAVIVAVGWGAVWLMVRRGHLTDHHPLPKREPDEPLDQKLLATATMAATMGVALTLLCQADDKKQVLAAVAISSFLGTLAAYAFIPTRPLAWYLAGALVVGLVGYISGFFSPAGLELGHPLHFFRALARPLPLDYAAASPLGTIWGYWVSRGWHAKRTDVEDIEEPDPAPLAP